MNDKYERLIKSSYQYCLFLLSRPQFWIAVGRIVAQACRLLSLRLRRVVSRYSLIFKGTIYLIKILYLCTVIKSNLVMKSINDLLNQKIEVRNFEGDHDNSVNWLDYYFHKKFNSLPFTSMNCPSCGNKMYHKKENHNIDDNSIMVGGHVTWMKELYILPICKECNDRKGNLPPFKVEFGRLCKLPQKQFSTFSINICINKSYIAIIITYIKGANISNG